MAEPDRRPTAEEIEELIDLVRRDPSSPAFVDLGDAYLALGRPRDAIEVANAGLRAAPESLEGRVMLSRALVDLHQWKEAQAELLRVVKVDRASRLGFTLLGEVLMRRADYERALPVLQHAQNLDPANSDVLNMLKRARSGQPLDPPPPLPTPLAPRKGFASPVPSPAPAGKKAGKAPPPPPGGSHSGYDDGPTTVAPSRKLAAEADPTEISPPPEMVAPAPRRTAPVAAAPVAAAVEVEKSRMPPPKAKEPAREPVMSADGTKPRPRVIPAARPVNAAAASLRQSAAVGEGYLNDLLTGGLLDIPGVDAPEVAFDIRPDRRWGRSTTRAFVVLFLVLVLGVGGGGGWYYWTQRATAEEIANHRAIAAKAKLSGSWDGLETAVTQLRSALNRDPSSILTLAEVAEVTALEALLYGTEADRVDTAIKAARDLDKPEKKDQPGYRELLIAKAAIELSRLPSREAPATTLATVRASLDGWLEGHADDHWARWLQGRAMLAAGQRTAAHKAFEQASAGDGAAPVALVDNADMLVDEGKHDEAMKLYERALSLAPDHPLAILGQALARAARGVENEAAMSDLNVKLEKPLGPRVNAYRQLAYALAYYGLEDYVQFRKSLEAATGPTEPRFLARVALARVLAGDLAPAAEARGQIAWYGKDKAESDPLVALVDAALLLASGLPEKALDTAKGDSVRAELLRGQALMDLGRAKDALTELDGAVKSAPDSIEAQILREEAHVIAATGKERAAAMEELTKLSRKAKTKLGRHALGAAMLAIGADPKETRTRLEQAIADIAEDAPNPVAYRTRTALAELDLAAGNLDGAAQHIEEATKANPGYLPALALRSRVALAKGDADTALELLGPVVKERTLTPVLELTLAEALARHKDASDQDRKDAIAALERAKAGGAPPAEIGRVAALVDPALPESLGVPAPKGDGASKDKGKDRDKGKDKKRGGKRRGR